MKKLLSLLFFVFLFSCSGKNINDNAINTAIKADIDSLNPYKFVSSSTKEIMYNVYEGLVMPNENGEVKPAIAKSFSISKDGLEYDFEIRDDVYFHSGNKLSMEDVVFSLEKMKELKLEPAFDNITKIESKDKNVKIYLQKPDSSLIYYLITPIVEKKLYDTLDQKENGTGPYYIEIYEREQKIVLKKFDKYYGLKANIPVVNINVVASDDATFLKLLSNEYNFYSGVSYKRVSELNDFNIFKNSQNMMFILGINNERFDKETRAKIDSAINREDIIQKVTNGYAKKLTEDKNEVVNLKGLKLKLKIPTNSNVYIDAAQVVKNQLVKMGADVDIIQIEWASWLQEVYTNKDYDITLIALTGKLDKDSVYRRFRSDYKRNFINFKNEEYDKLIDLAKKEVDVTLRNSLYEKAFEILKKENASVFIMDMETIVAAKKIEGYVNYKIPYVNFSVLKFGEK